MLFRNIELSFPLSAFIQHLKKNIKWLDYIALTRPSYIELHFSKAIDFTEFAGCDYIKLHCKS